MVVPDSPALPAMTDEEAAKERLIAEEALADDLKAQVAENTADPEAAAAKKERTPRVHYANKLDRIKARHGDNLGNYLVLEVADAELEGDALKAKQDETLAIIDGMGMKVKNRASLLIDWAASRNAVVQSAGPKQKRPYRCRRIPATGTAREDRLHVRNHARFDEDAGAVGRRHRAPNPVGLSEGVGTHPDRAEAGGRRRGSPRRSDAKVCRDPG